MEHYIADLLLKSQKCQILTIKKNILKKFLNSLATPVICMLQRVSELRIFF